MPAFIYSYKDKMTRWTRFATLFLLIVGVAIFDNVCADPKLDYETKCAACHGLGVAGAPKVGDSEAWESRVAKDIETLYENAILGFTGEVGVMPPKGGFSALSGDQVKAIVDYMVSVSR